MNHATQAYNSMMDAVIREIAGRPEALEMLGSLCDTIHAPGTVTPVVRTLCEGFIAALLDQPNIRAQIRAVAEHPRYAKRFQSLLAHVQRLRPEILTERGPKARFPADLGKSGPSGGVHLEVRLDGALAVTLVPAGGRKTKWPTWPNGSW